MDAQLHPHDVPVLVRARLLKPLGNPPANARKLFATEEVLEFARDKAWLGKVSNASSDGVAEKESGVFSAAGRI